MCFFSQQYLWNFVQYYIYFDLKHKHHTCEQYNLTGMFHVEATLKVVTSLWESQIIESLVIFSNV